MEYRRRSFLKSLSLGALFPWNILDNMFLLNLDSNRLKEFYKKAIVIDGLIIPRGWNDESFRALDDSGYTGFSASLYSRNFQVAMSSLLEWNEKIKQNYFVKLIEKYASSNIFEFDATNFSTDLKISNNSTI